MKKALVVIGLVVLEILSIWIAYQERGCFRVGGEWLVLPVGIGVWLFTEEVIQTIWKMLGREEGDYEELDH